MQYSNLIIYYPLDIPKGTYTKGNKDKIEPIEHILKRVQLHVSNH